MSGATDKCANYGSAVRAVRGPRAEAKRIEAWRGDAESRFEVLEDLDDDKELREGMMSRAHW